MDWMNQIDTSIRDFLVAASDVNPWLCLAVLLVVLFLETSLLVGMIIPGEAAVLLAAGVLGNAWAPALFFLIIVASVLGQTGGYALGRAVGPGIRRTWIGRKLGEQRWERAEAVVQGTGGRALIGTRFIPFVHAVTPAAAGTLRIQFRRFLLFATIGASLWSAMLTVATVALGQAAEVVGYGWIGLLITAIGSMGAVTSIGRAVRNLRRDRGSAPETAASTEKPAEQDPATESNTAAHEANQRR